MIHTRHRRQLIVAIAVLCAGPLLAGCGDLGGLGDESVRDLIEKAESLIEEAEEQAAQDEEAAQEQREAFEEAKSWPARPPDPPTVTPTSTSGGTDGDFAAEDRIYPADAYDDVVQHYTEHYGTEPTDYGTYRQWMRNDADPREISTTLTRGPDGDFSVTNVWHAP
jgi:hypothetical protein